jgi:hypothetical protein
MPWDALDTDTPCFLHLPLQLTYKCIVQHATWRMHHVPKGYVDEVRVGAAGDWN